MAQIQFHVNNQAMISKVPETVGLSAAGSKSPAGDLFEQILAAVAKKQYEKAISLSHKRNSMDLDVINARGVCYLRKGNYKEAVALFRDLVLQPGCTWMRKDRPSHYKTNFATALLLAGHPSGCLEILSDLDSQSPAIVQKLRFAIKKWQSTLPFWAWLNWKIGRIDPANQPVVLDFEPGDFECQHAIETPDGQQDPTTQTS